MSERVHVLGIFDDMDTESAEAMAEDYTQYKWSIEEGSVECDFGEMTVDELVKTFESFDDEMDDDDLLTIEDLELGDSFEIDRGRGLTYVITGA